MTGQEPGTPESLAADFERIASWMETRPAGVTWTGDGLDGTVAGLRDAAKSLREHLVPAWDAKDAEIARLRAEAAGARQERDVYQRAASIACRERDDARADADRLRPLEAEAQHAHGEATALRVQHAQARGQLEEIRAMVEATRPHFSAEQLGIVLQAIHDAAALEPKP